MAEERRQSEIEIDEDARHALVDGIVELDKVRAAAVVDREGNFEYSKGEARAFRSGDAAHVQGEGTANREDVYVTSLGEAAFLVVVFPVEVDFDEVETEVRRLLEEHA